MYICMCVHILYVCMHEMCSCESEQNILQGRMPDRNVVPTQVQNIRICIGSNYQGWNTAENMRVVRASNVHQ